MTENGEKLMDYLLEDFFILAEDNTAYLDRLLLTLEINKIEAKYQKSDKPNLFIKELDEFGLVKNFTKNSKSTVTVPTPRREFTADEMSRILDELEREPEKMKALNAMIRMGLIERKIYSIDNQTGKPVFIKKYDEGGFAMSYQMNS